MYIYIDPPVYTVSLYLIPLVLYGYYVYIYMYINIKLSQTFLQPFFSENRQIKAIKIIKIYYLFVYIFYIYLFNTVVSFFVYVLI